MSRGCEPLCLYENKQIMGYAHLTVTSTPSQHNYLFMNEAIVWTASLVLQIGYTSEISDEYPNMVMKSL